MNTGVGALELQTASLIGKEPQSTRTVFQTLADYFPSLLFILAQTHADALHKSFILGINGLLAKETSDQRYGIKFIIK